MFATCSWPSLCKQSELQCWRRNRRLCGSVQISATRALPLTFDISILNALPFRGAVASLPILIFLDFEHPPSPIPLYLSANAGRCADVPRPRCARVWEQRRSRLGAETVASVSRDGCVWEQRRLRLGPRALTKIGNGEKRTGVPLSSTPTDVTKQQCHHAERTSAKPTMQNEENYFYINVFSF